MFERILAGTDGTSRAEEAVRLAARMAFVTGAALEIVHVARPQLPGAATPGRDRLAAADRLLERAGRLAGRLGVAADLRVLVGEPAEMLALEAERRWSDLVCVGPDAGFAERPHLLGGVAAHLLHRSVRPTLVARPTGDPGRFPARVLVAVDGSDGSGEAVRFGAAVAAAAGAELRMLHAVEVAGGRRVGWTLEGEREGFEPLEPAVALARDLGVSAGREMALGRPGPAIARAAADWSADLVVVGARGLGGLARVALGSVSDWLVRHAGRTVVVARDRAHAGRTTAVPSAVPVDVAAGALG
jgi:nucleotide-binding universal stress UspA family protein